MNKNYLIPNWPAAANVRAYSTTRMGGFSKAPYDSFNLGYSSGDERDAVNKNRDKLRQDLALPAAPIWLHQVHSASVVVAEQCENSVQADASYTQMPNTVCIIMTADCLPILLCNTAGTEVAAVHAGWRGLAGGIIAAALKKFQSPSSEILAWLGPAIGPEIYEVSEEVRQQFLSLDPATAAAFKPSANGKWLANLYALAKQLLNDYGVTQIYGGGFCTYTDSQRFYSHRRDQGKTGRMASLIWMDSFLS